jgi:hypothetical protein
VENFPIVGENPNFTSVSPVTSENLFLPRFPPLFLFTFSLSPFLYHLHLSVWTSFAIKNSLQILLVQPFLGIPTLHHQNHIHSRLNIPFIQHARSLSSKGADCCRSNVANHAQAQTQHVQPQCRVCSASSSRQRLHGQFLWSIHQSSSSLACCPLSPNWSSYDAAGRCNGQHGSRLWCDDLAKQLQLIWQAQ